MEDIRDLRPEEVAAAYPVMGAISLHRLPNGEDDRNLLWEARGDQRSWFVKQMWRPRSGPPAALPDADLYRQTAFERRMEAHGLPVPAPAVSSRPWLHGAVPIEPGASHQQSVDRIVFTAHEFEPALRVPDASNAAEVRLVLHQVGATLGAMQAVARGIGPWQTYPAHGATSLRRTAMLAAETGRGGDWAELVLAQAGRIEAVARMLPLDSDGGRLMHGDLAGRNVRVGGNHRVRVLDWDGLQLVEPPLGEELRSWAEWARDGGAVSADEAWHRVDTAHRAGLRFGRPVPVAPAGPATMAAQRTLEQLIVRIDAAVAGTAPADDGQIRELASTFLSGAAKLPAPARPSATELTRPTAPSPFAVPRVAARL